MYNLKYYLSQVEDILAHEDFIGNPAELYQPVAYTLRLGGKRIRPTLLLAANGLFDGDAAMVRGAALGIETFHNFTLLHDDLMDRSPLRRGKPTVYTRWGDNAAILSGDTMFALAWRYFLRTPHPGLREILQCFNDTAIEVCEGQQLDMNFEHRSDVTLDEYMEMIRLKTAVLLACALKLGALYAGAPQRETDLLYRFGIHTGLAFQLQDDLLDGYGDTAVFGKKTGQDIRDNKKTFLPLLALKLASEQNRQDEARRLNALFAEKDCADEEQKVREVMEVYERLGLRAHVEAAIRKEFELAVHTLDEVAADEEHKAPLRELLESLSERKK